MFSYNGHNARWRLAHVMNMSKRQYDHVGYVLCEDHSCMRPEDYFRQSKQKGIGVVFAEQTKDHPLMAVMLEEINNAF